MTNSLYLIFKALHIYGFIMVVGITAANLIAYQQFFKIYAADRAQGVSSFRIIQKLTTAGMIGMITVLVAGITMLGLAGWGYASVLWFQVKLGLIVAVFVNGVTMGRLSYVKIDSLMKGESNLPLEAIQKHVKTFFTIQLTIFFTIVVMSVFRFS